MDQAWVRPTPFSPIPVPQREEDDEDKDENEKSIMKSMEYICGLIDQEVGEWEGENVLGEDDCWGL